MNLYNGDDTMNNQEKTLENLMKEKEIIINEWFNEINNFEKDDDFIWCQKNRTFASKLYNILYLLPKNSNSNNIKLQYDLINIIGKYINEKNRNKVLSIIKNLKSLEISTSENNNLDIFDIDSYIKGIDNKIFEIESEELKGKPETEQAQLKNQWKNDQKEFDDIVSSFEESIKEKQNSSKLNEDDTISQIINKIKAMPIGKEFTISSLMNEPSKDDIGIAIDTLKRLNELKILIKPKYAENAITGLPQNIPYIKLNNNMNETEAIKAGFTTFKLTNDTLKAIIKKIINNDDPSLNNQIYEIIKKIIDLPLNTNTTIATLINYNPNQVFVEPITQDKIMNLVNEICKKLNIKLETNKDSFGKLAYYRQFKKINELTLIDKITLNGDEKNV